jgi:hypothetical protein
MIAGLFRTLLTIVFVWFVFRWLDRMFGGGRRQRQTGAGRSNPTPRSAGGRGRRSKPDDNRVGEYVDYEEIDN